jgi:hypothetical protein
MAARPNGRWQARKNPPVRAERSPPILADAKSKNQAIFTLSQLHAELAGFAENRNAGVKIKTAMMQVEAVQPGAVALGRQLRRGPEGSPDP